MRRVASPPAKAPTPQESPAASPKAATLIWSGITSHRPCRGTSARPIRSDRAAACSTGRETTPRARELCATADHTAMQMRTAERRPSPLSGVRSHHLSRPAKNAGSGNRRDTEQTDKGAHSLLERFLLSQQVEENKAPITL